MSISYNNDIKKDNYEGYKQWIYTYYLIIYFYTNFISKSSKKKYRKMDINKILLIRLSHNTIVLKYIRISFRKQFIKD